MKWELQSDKGYITAYEAKLLYKASGLKLHRCAGIIFPSSLSIAALCLLNFSPLVFPFDFSLVLPESRDLFNV